MSSRFAGAVLLIAVISGCGRPDIGTTKAGQENAKRESEFLSREALFSMKLRCAEQGNKYYATLTKEQTKGFIATGPWFTYNLAMNTCIYKGGYIDSSYKRQTSFIFDLLSGEELATSYLPMDRREWTMADIQSDQEFSRKERVLFVEQPIPGIDKKAAAR